MNFFDLKGKRIESINGLCVDSDEYSFTLHGGDSLKFSHFHDCCEHVRVALVDGDPASVIGKVITLAEEDSPMEFSGVEHSDDSHTFTVFKIQVADGSTLVVVWLGESNGYYSESVDVDFSPFVEGGAK